MRQTLSILLAVAFFGTFAATVSADTAEPQRAVLITGASSGIGRMTTERLAGSGFFVYAGARNQDDLDELDALDNVQAVRIDVTVQQDIDDAVALVRREGRGLWGLVNNAGVNLEEPLIEADESTLEFVLNVNVYGVFRVTKAFAPLIIESQGRVINISSIGGILSGGWTGFGPYTMSKHAIEGFTDQLAFEMAKFDVAVSAIEPGSFATSIGKSRCRRMLAQRAQRKYRYFGEEMGQHYRDCEETLAAGSQALSPAPEPVAAAIEHALSSDSPKEHYLVVSSDIEAQLTIGKLLEELVQLNGDHEHSLDRAEIIDMLDAEEAIRTGSEPGDVVEDQ